ncbi:hypothetical protein B0H21DRAFT_550311 [Amylocystis lapponica]|nr:hypothetical protein B0H21DRAFT_550311 [Amylocystis lapponica]
MEQGLVAESQSVGSRSSVRLASYVLAISLLVADLSRHVRPVGVYRYSFVAFVRALSSPCYSYKVQSRRLFEDSSLDTLVLSLNVDDAAETIPLPSYGLDSLMSIRLSGILRKDFGISVTQMQLLSSYMTGKIIRRLSVHG